MPVIVLTDDEWECELAELSPKFVDLLENGKNPSEISSEVLSIVNRHPTSACAEALAAAVIETSRSVPKQTDTFVQAVSSLWPDFKSIMIDYSGAEENFFEVFNIRFLELLNATQLDLPLHSTVETSNITLIYALLSGSSIREGLVERYSSLYRLTYDGLQLSTNKTQPGNQEVAAVGACLQLSIAGKCMVDGELGASYKKEAIIQALKNLVVDHPGGRRLLQEVISSAETGFTESYTAQEAWSRLFFS